MLSRGRGGACAPSTPPCCPVPSSAHVPVQPWLATRRIFWGSSPPVCRVQLRTCRTAGRRSRIRCAALCWPTPASSLGCSNFNCVMLDCGPVRIGDRVLLGPNVQLYPGGCLMHEYHTRRSSGWVVAAICGRARDAHAGDSGGCGGCKLFRRGRQRQPSSGWLLTAPTVCYC